VTEIRHQLASGQLILELVRVESDGNLVLDIVGIQVVEYRRQAALPRVGGLRSQSDESGQ
jgi:hypothetical protein